MYQQEQQKGHVYENFTKSDKPLMQAYRLNTRQLRQAPHITHVQIT